MDIKTIKILYIVCVVIIPVAVSLINENYLFAGLFMGVGVLFYLIDTNKKVQKIVDKFF